MIALCIFGAFGGLLLCVSLYRQLGEGWSAIRSELVLTPMVAGMILRSILSSAMVGRIGRSVLYVGMLLMSSGTLLLAGMLSGGGEGSALMLSPGLFFVGAGAGATFGKLFQFMLNSVSMEEVGSNSSVLEATQQLAKALGVAVLGTVFFTLFKDQASALRVTVLACLLPLGITVALVSLLPAQPGSKG